MGIVTIGADIGQRVDPTAIAVVETERRDRDDGRGAEVHHTARFLERLALGTPYPAVAKRLAEIVARLHEHGAGPLKLYVDATGVGTPVVDMMKETGLRAKLLPVYFTHGDRRTVEHGQVSLGKAWLVSRLQALLQSGRLHLPKTAEAEALAKELLDYEIHVDAQANDTYGAFKVGTHDDLVTALGLATMDDPLGIDVAPLSIMRAGGSPWIIGRESVAPHLQI